MTHDAIKLPLMPAEDEGMKCRKWLHCFAKALYASITNVIAARKERNRIMYSKIDLLIKVEVDGVECSVESDFSASLRYVKPPSLIFGPLERREK
jgi:hypothetical protein